jgi:DNA invertase Pin-like site-specific DNA recombinase
VQRRMLADVRVGRIQAVAVWALDRLHRSMTGAINTVLELDRLGVPVLSVREGWLDTSGPVRPLLVAIFGWVAEQERTRLIERTKAGIERARREGKVLGRPKVSQGLLHAARDLVASGVPVAEAARCKGSPGLRCSGSWLPGRRISRTCSDKVVPRVNRIQRVRGRAK